jgi:hypothetical protein
MHPLAERLDRPFFFPQMFGEIGQLLNLMAVNRLEEGLSRRKMTVKGANPDTRRSRDSFEARFRSAGAEHGSCSLKQAVAIAQRVGAWLS